MNNIMTGWERIIIISLVFSFLAFSITQASATAIVSIANLTSNPGETVTTPISIENVTDYGTGTISVTYDPAVVHVTDVASGPASTVLAWNPDNTTGITNISAWNLEGVSGDIIFANVTFLAVGSPGTSTILKLDVITLKDISIKDIPVSVSDGTFGIKEDRDVASSPTPAPAVTPTPALSPQPSPTPLPAGGGEEKATPITSRWKLPGFESIFACFAFISAFIILMVKIRGAKRE